MSGDYYFCAEIHSGRIELSPEEAHHAAAVMRVRRGQPVVLFDGQGQVASGTVSAVTRRSVSVEVMALATQRPRPLPRLELYVATPKGSRQHVLVEKCTELGVSAIHPLLTERSVVRPAAGVLAKWRRYAVEAAKQSGQSWLPEIGTPKPFAESLFVADTALALIASPEPRGRPIRHVLRDLVEPESSVHVWIGPEGGFTSTELGAAAGAGLQAVALGESILRIETAAIAVAALTRLGLRDG